MLVGSSLWTMVTCAELMGKQKLRGMGRPLEFGASSEGTVVGSLPQLKAKPRRYRAWEGKSQKN